MLTANKSNKDYYETEYRFIPTTESESSRNIKIEFTFYFHCNTNVSECRRLAQEKGNKLRPKTKYKGEEILRRKVHYVSFGYCKQKIMPCILDAYRPLCTNRIDTAIHSAQNTIMCCFPLQMATRRMLFFAHFYCIIYFVYTAIAFDRAHTAIYLVASHTNQQSVIENGVK